VNRVVLWLSLTLCAHPALAGGSHHSPPPSHTPPSHTPSHTPSQHPDTPEPPKPADYKFVVVKDGTFEEMRIEGVGTPGKDGYIEYEHIPGTDQVSIHGVKGIERKPGVKPVPGIGEALKRELLRRYPKKVVTSQLVEVNRTRLLEAWAKTYPHHASGEDLQRVVPALKFEGFDYEITAEPSNTGHSGSIHLKMTPTESTTSITVTNPDALDAILLSSPQRPTRISRD
jgi:hypothetical protein